MSYLGGGRPKIKSILKKEKTVAIKGVAVLLIVLGHCANALHVDNKYFSVNVGWYCVVLFFFLSGYGLIFEIKNKENYLQYFFQHRIIKVIIPFLSAHVIYITIKMIMGIHITIKDIVLGLIGMSTVVDNSWYPVAIIIMYIMFL